jgi:hypothetical protein
LSDPADVRGFLPSQSGASQLGLGQGGDPVGRYRAGKALESSVGGAASRQRYLLLEDDLHEGLEAGGAVPQRRRAVARDDRSEVRVAPGELGNAIGKAFVRQSRRHHHQTKHLTVL